MVTNGEATEPQYFRLLEKELGDVVIDVRSYRKNPAALAETAKRLLGNETRANKSSASRSADGFRRAYVVTDVDEFTVQQFQDARRICKDSGIELVISNPCFEAWLLDHLACCPDSYSKTKDVERKTAGLGIVGGSRDKYVNYDKIEGARDSARKSTSGHNTEERGRGRAQLNSLDFGPWTDMAAMVTQMAEDAGQ